ncbi:hypothetical protein [Swingsia samuiensis]|uniref:XRE family transcriptional regulator n=1 Tax=Swingsia samuiensis TaxID=1293412 RepID=A0A4Y6UIK7_9PROT|nr:hypothetical protein [Swingsia samuiensis]QDH17433.1 hypothetical protein E3D00_07545 [Swingsia samuiensis]
MGNNRAIIDRMLPKNDRKFPRMSAASSSQLVRERLLAAIKREFTHLRSGPEMLARAAMKSPRAARNWLSGLNAPDAEALIELMASSETLREEVLRLVHERQSARGTSNALV